MPTFKDTADREWSVSANRVSLRDVETETGVCLAAPDGKQLLTLDSNPTKLVDVLWILCRQQAEAAQVDENSFGAAITGEALDAGHNAVIDAALAFLPSRQRQVLAAMRDAYRSAIARGIEVATQAMTDPELLQNLSRGLQSTINGIVQSVGRQPASPDLAAMY